MPLEETSLINKKPENTLMKNLEITPNYKSVQNLRLNL